MTRSLTPIAGALALAGCFFGGDDAPVAPPPSTPLSQALQVEERTGLIDVRIIVPEEAYALPGVGERLASEARAQRATVERRARELRAERPDLFRPAELSVVWTVAYESDEAVSLLGEMNARETGASARLTFASVLYDRRAAREVGFRDLFADARAGGVAMTAVSEAAFAAWADASPRVGDNLALVDERTLRDARDALSPRAGSFSTFVLVPGERGDGRIAGVTLLYPAGALGPQQDGPYRLFVPTEVLAPHLSAAWAARFGGQGT